MNLYSIGIVEFDIYVTDKLTDKSYKELPSASWKLISSPDNAPSVSGVEESSPQTASDC